MSQRKISLPTTIYEQIELIESVLGKSKWPGFERIIMDDEEIKTFYPFPQCGVVRSGVAERGAIRKLHSLYDIYAMDQNNHDCCGA